jgi:hypothetical protein
MSSASESCQKNTAKKRKLVEALTPCSPNINESTLAAEEDPETVLQQVGISTSDSGRLEVSMQSPRGVLQVGTRCGASGHSLSGITPGAP